MNSLKFEIQLGTSGHLELEEKWLNKMLEIFELFCTKQHDYGSNNIAKHGELGVIVRADDKFERLRTLLNSKANPSNETLRDTWMDLAGYAVIGLLCRDGEWPERRPTEISIKPSMNPSFHHPNPED